jgi:SAM-dependent methyltransferase
MNPSRTIISPLTAIKSKAASDRWVHVSPEAENYHLGGYARGPIGDVATYYPNLWTWAIKLLDIRSVIDIGCGEGCSTQFFLGAGCEVLGVEGYRPAVENSRVPGRVVLHDYSTGPFFPNRDFDMAWSCEFVEHVEEQYIPNFFATFACAGCVFMTFAKPGQGGHHHVNEQEQGYWIAQFRQRGFDFDEELTACGRIIAMADRYLVSPNYPSHFIEKGLVFLRRSPARISEDGRN